MLKPRQPKLILQHATFFMMRDLLRCSRRLSISWRKLFFVGAIVTMAGFVLPMWLLLQPVTVSSHNSLNGSMQLSKSLNVARTEQFQHITAAPIRNSSVEVTQMERKRRKEEKLEFIATPPPPPPATPPSHLQVKILKPAVFFLSSTITISIASNLNTLSHISQRQIWRLSSSKALMFAKNEIQRAPVLVEDPELYAPVFQNVSVFKRYTNIH